MYSASDNGYFATVQKNIERCVVIVLGALLCATAFSANAPGVAERAAADIDAGTFFPNGDSNTLLFSFYSLEEPQLSTAREHGVSAVGPYYGRQGLNRELEKARAAQLPLLYAIGPKIDFLGTEMPDIAAATELLRAEVASAVKQTGIGAWALSTEELRHWRPAEMQWLEQATAIIRNSDPLKRPIFMYEPNHRGTESLVKTSRYLDLIAKGAYANHVGMQSKRTWVRWSVEQAVEAAKQSSNIPIAVLWMARDQETPEDIAAIRKWARHDVYLSLVTGAKGIIVWSGFNKRPGFRRHFRDFYEGYLSAAHDLNIDPGLGRVFLRGITGTDITASVTYGPATQKFRYRDKKYTYPTISIKQLRLDDQHYLFVVNSASEACRVQLKGLPDNRSILNALTKQPATIAADGEISMTAYDVQIFTWPHSQPESGRTAVSENLR